MSGSGERIITIEAELPPDFGDEKILELVRTIGIRLDTLYRQKGGKGLRNTEIENDEPQSIEILHHTLHGVREKIVVIIRLIPRNDADALEPLHAVVKDLQKEGMLQKLLDGLEETEDEQC